MSATYCIGTAYTPGASELYIEIKDVKAMVGDIILRSLFSFFYLLYNLGYADTCTII